MEDKDALIAKLRSDIKARDDDIHLAATLGKELVEENQKLKSRIDELHAQNELLEQEKHSLQLDLERQMETVRSLTGDTDLLREQADSSDATSKQYQKDIETLNKKIEALTKENLYLKKAQDDLNVEKTSLNEAYNLLKKQISNFEDQAEKSLCEAERDESQELKAQLSVYMLNNKELQEALTQCQLELELAKKNEKHLLQIVHELEENVSEKASEISAYCDEIKKAKEEIEELHGEIEILKFDQIDVNKRGNSVFAELDDRRTLVEKEYKKLRNKYEQFAKDYEENKKELDRARGQIAILQSKIGRDYQQGYIDKLEDSLSSARREIHDLMLKFKKVVKSNEEKSEINWKDPKYDYLRIMLKQSQKKEEELLAEVVNLRASKIYQDDKLVKADRIVYKLREDICTHKQEICQLKLKVKELEQGIMHKLPEEPVARKPRIEILEGYVPPKEKKDVLKKSIFSNVPDDFIIPAEIELGEDGFHQTKPARKSNRFILREFNKIEEPEDGESNQPSTSALTKGNLVEETGKAEPNVENQSTNLEMSKNLSTVRRSRQKNSKRRDENCAQQ